MRSYYSCNFIHNGCEAARLDVISSGNNKPKNLHSIHDPAESNEKKVIKQIIEICLIFVEIVDMEID
jgi:hypothetical protein